jgi:hypothetical protein
MSSGRASDAQPEAAAADASAAVTPVAPLRPGARLLAPIDDRSWQVRSINLAMAVDDPAEALAAARKAVEKLGGEVTNASANGDNASLGATVPIRRHEAVRAALSRIEGIVQNESSSTADQRPYVEQLHDRGRLLTHAQSQLDAMMRSATEPRTVDALTLLHQLAKQDLDNVTTQIANYARQTEASQVYVTFVRTASGAGQPLPHR